MEKAIRGYGKEEKYREIFDCPRCEETELFYNYKFCPMCGFELDWSFIDEEYEKETNIPKKTNRTI